MIFIFISICLLGILITLIYLTLMVKYVGKQLKNLVDKKDISVINEVEETVNFLSDLAEKEVEKDKEKETKEESLEAIKNFINKGSKIHKLF